MHFGFCLEKRAGSFFPSSLKANFWCYEFNKFKLIDCLRITSGETDSNCGCCQSHSQCVCVWRWWYRGWVDGDRWKGQAAIKGEKMKWHLTLLDACERRAATDVQSSLGTCGNREEREIRSAERWCGARGWSRQFNSSISTLISQGTLFEGVNVHGQKLLLWQN